MQHRKRVLLINPARADGFLVTRIHAGLCILGGILKDAGHEVRIYDYAYLRHLVGQIDIPQIGKVVQEFKPDAIGISVFTYCFDACQLMIGELSRLTSAPIILGGPHFTMFPDDFKDDRRVAAVLQGEAEEHILGIIDSVGIHETGPRFVRCVPPGGDEIPALNLDIAFGREYLKDFQIQLSRGCPYHCSFCNIQHIAGRHIRKRDISKCIEQITDAKARYPRIKTVAITDDCPTADIERFKTFLHEMAKRDLGLNLWIDNVRANLIDEEMLDLYKAAGGRNLCLGVESGNQHVFAAVNKGETLSDIENAAALIRRKKIVLGTCFIIGLPGDNALRHRDSIRLMRRLKPDYAFWNMCVPWPGTEIQKWFSKNGSAGDPRNFSTLIDCRGGFQIPIADSPDFTASERVAAWLGANLEMPHWFSNPKDMPRLLWLSIKHGTMPQFFTYLGRSFTPLAGEYLKFAAKALVRKVWTGPRRIAASISRKGK